jgi:bacterioferritin
MRALRPQYCRGRGRAPRGDERMWGRRLRGLPSRRNSGVNPRERRASGARAECEKEFMMRGDVKVIEYLNQGLRSELTAVNQYWLHYRIFDNWGFTHLAKKWREESIEEMQHADKFTKRILFLEGFPNMQTLNPLRIGESVKEIIDADLVTEIEARALYLEAAAYCLSINDRVSQNLFEEIVTSEERHIDFLETQNELIKQLGVELYSQKQMGEADS